VSPHTFGVRPRLLPFLIAILALAILLPWLGGGQWHGEAVRAVQAVRDGRPFSQPDRAGYLILGMAADALLPSSTSRDLNLLGFAAAVLAALAVARLRGILARGGAEIDRWLEPLAAAFALLAAGPFLARAVAADRAPVEAFLAASAASLAWTGRLPAGATVFGLLLLVSSRALLGLPMLLAAPRPRGDLAPSVWGLLPWLVYALVIQYAGGEGGALALFRPEMGGRSGPMNPWRTGLESEPAGQILALGVGMGGVLALAMIGAAVGLLRGGPHRRFVGGVGVTLGLHALVLAPGSEWGQALVPVVPWIAVLAAAGVASLRRAANRVSRVRLGPAGAAFGCVVLALNLGLAVQHLVGPAWRDAARFQTLCRDLGEITTATHYRVTGAWDDLRLYELSTDFQLKPWEIIPGPPIPDNQLLAAADRARLDAELARRSVLVFGRRRFAIPLAQDSLGTAQIFADHGAVDQGAGEGWVASFGSGLVLERIEVLTPLGRRAGGLVTLRLAWRAEWPLGELPTPSESGDVRTAELKVGTSIVNSSGRICLDVTHWLAHGIAGLGELGGRHFTEMLVFRMPDELAPGDYGVEIAVFEPLSGEGTALDLDLGFLRQRRLPVHTAGNPPGVTPRSVRAASFRLQFPAAVTSIE
jgi:hypothetical protein